MERVRLNKPAAIVLAAVMSVSPITATAARPKRDSIVAQLERLGFSCSSNPNGGDRGDWASYPKPSFTILLVVEAEGVKSLSFITAPVGETPILTAPDPMIRSAELEFEGSNPSVVRAWLERCVGSVGSRPRPEAIWLGEGHYVCTGEPNAPGYFIYWQ